VGIDFVTGGFDVFAKDAAVGAEAVDPESLVLADSVAIRQLLIEAAIRFLFARNQ